MAVQSFASLKNFAVSQFVGSSLLGDVKLGMDINQMGQQFKWAFKYVS